MADAPAQREVQLANPRGFCAGVDRAIQIVERALEIHGAPVYVLHEIVHNRHVLENLSARGVIFVKEVEEVPENSVMIFSAHGVAPEVFDQADRYKLQAIDAGVNFNASLIDISDALEGLLEDCLQTITQIDGLEPEGNFVREIAVELACEWAD